MDFLVINLIRPCAEVAKFPQRKSLKVKTLSVLFQRSKTNQQLYELKRNCTVQSSGRYKRNSTCCASNDMCCPGNVNVQQIVCTLIFSSFFLINNSAAQPAIQNLFCFYCYNEKDCSIMVATALISVGQLLYFVCSGGIYAVYEIEVRPYSGK